jgi:hypothetical protein
MSNPSAENPQPRQLVLVKKDQRFVFRYQRGEEKAVIAQLAETARDAGNDFDWFDAAVLSHQMGCRMSHQLKSMMDE